MKTHLHLSTRDLAESVAFYRTLLGSEPLKSYGDYALFVTEDPGLELALSINPQTKTSSDAHYGIAVHAPEQVDFAIERLKAAGLPVDIETEETCCYATQTKVWASDPDGRRWETYYVIAETEKLNDEDMACCQGDDATATCCS
jgi:catechol 2,3-dioxygenase-like lactoylglutathione lyase family enzyme